MPLRAAWRAFRHGALPCHAAIATLPLLTLTMMPPDADAMLLPLRAQPMPLPFAAAALIFYDDAAFRWFAADADVYCHYAMP